MSSGSVAVEVTWSLPTGKVDPGGAVQVTVAVDGTPSSTAVGGV